MKSFEAELGAAKGKDVERKYVEQAGAGEAPQQTVLDGLDTPELSLESSTDEKNRIALARERTAGMSPNDIAREVIEKARQESRGFNPSLENPIDIPQRVQEAEAKNANREKEQRILFLENEVQKAEVAYTALAVDVMNLEARRDGEQDPVKKAATEKVLAQFTKEREDARKKLDQWKEELGAERAV